MSARRTRRRRPGRAGVPAADPADDRPARGRHRHASRRPGSAGASSSAGCTVGGEVVVSGKVKHFGRKLTLDNPEFQVVAERGREVLHAGRIVPVYRLTAGLTAARLRIAIREALDRAGHAYPEYLPAAILRGGGARADRPGDRGGPLPGDVRGPRRGARAGWRSTSCWRSSSAWSRGGASASATRAPVVDARRRDGRARSGRRSTMRSTARVGRAGRADRRPGRGDRRDPRRPRRGRRRCSGSSRATSGRARPRSPRTRSRPRRGPGSRARCWRRPTCSPASTSRRSARCSTALGIGVTLLTGSLKADVEGQGPRGDRLGPGARSSSARTR